MIVFFEGRCSDSPYIEMIWHGQAGTDYTPTCPADPHWDMLLIKHEDHYEISVEGPLTRALYKRQKDWAEWVVFRFKIGVFMPFMPIDRITDSRIILPEGTRRSSFWLMGSTWQFPTFENVENFVDRLVHQDILVRDPLVSAVLQNPTQEPDYSDRTVRRRFLQATGLTPKGLQQIERAQQAAALLGSGVSILDTVYEAGYSDQPHLTRSMRRFYGQTPVQIAAAPQPV